MPERGKDSGSRSSRSWRESDRGNEVLGPERNYLEAASDGVVVISWHLCDWPFR